MQHPFDALAPEYANLLARMQITRQAEVTIVAGRLLGFVKEGRYKRVEEVTGVPEVFEATSFEREASSDFTKNPAQGWPLTSRSKWIPHNGPFPNWETAADAAYALDGLNKIGKGNWSWARFCYEGELFNGFGYRAHGIHSPYLWAGTNNYSKGKYVRDGVWDPNHEDTQLGIVPIARVMASTLKELDLPGWPTQVPTPPPVPQQAPIGVGGGDQNTAWVQASLNKILLLDPPLVVDNSYGRRTKFMVMAFQQAHGLAVDGLAGPLTHAAIEKALEGK